eukprot:COSAG02_NODE_50413_length_320_cov_1.294118_1_plen_24_part_01
MSDHILGGQLPTPWNRWNHSLIPG